MRRRRDCQHGSFTASNSYTPRLRHAMFRFNWPTSELMFGQYLSMFCEWYAESAEDGPMKMTGTPTARLAQIRFTQKFLERLDRGRPDRRPRTRLILLILMIPGRRSGPLYAADQQRPVGGNPPGPGESQLRPRLLG